MRHRASCLRQMLPPVSTIPSMEPVETDDCAGESAATFVFESHPNPSLTRPQERLVLGSLAALCLAPAGGFALLGYWPVLLLSGLELGLLAWFFKASRSHTGDYESLVIEGDLVVLDWRAGPCGERREMNRQWVHVVCACGAPGRNCLLGLKSHGRATQLGKYLSDEARLQLAATLRSRLRG